MKKYAKKNLFIEENLFTKKRDWPVVPYLGIFIPPLSSLLWTFNNFKWLLVIGTTKDFTSDHFWTSGGHFKCVCSTLLLKRDWSPYLGTTNTFSSISPKAKNEFGWKFVRLFIRASCLFTKHVSGPSFVPVQDTEMFILISQSFQTVVFFSKSAVCWFRARNVNKKIIRHFHTPSIFTFMNCRELKKFW